MADDSTPLLDAMVILVDKSRTMLARININVGAYGGTYRPTRTLVDGHVYRQVLDEERLLRDAQGVIAALQGPLAELVTRVAHAIDGSASAPVLAELRALRSLLEAQRPAGGAALPLATSDDIARLLVAIGDVNLSPEERRVAQWKRDEFERQERDRIRDAR